VLKSSEVMRNNELLARISSQSELVAFEEILPNMNDIFIKVVGDQDLENSTTSNTL
jgi:hypothetical protein